MTARARIPGIVAAALTITGLVLALCGLPLLFLWAAALAAAALLLSRWLSVGLVVAACAIGFLLIADLLLVAGSYIGFGMLTAQCAAWAVIGVGAGLASAVIPARERGWSNADRRLVLAAASGAIVTLLLTVIGAILPGAVHIAWAMNDDSVRDLLVARQIMTTSTSIGPTPLPFGISAANMLPGRASVPASDLLRFDVTRMAEVWIAVAAATCLLLGVIAARVVRGVRAWISIPLTIVVSLAGLGWWVIGIQLADGYLNAGFAIALLLAAWLVYLESERRPVLSLLMLCAAALAVLPIWSPMVICMAALASVVLVRLLARRSVRLAVLMPAALVVLALAATLPFGIVTAAVQSNDLDKDGGFPELSTPILFAFIAVILIVMIADAVRTGLRHLASGAIALVVAGGIGMAYLLYQRRNSADLLGYYPEKFSWLMAVLLGMVGITVLGSLLVRRPLVGRAARAVLASLVVAGLGVAIVASWVSAPERVSPIFGILEGEVFGVGNADADIVFRLIDEGRKPNPAAAASNRSNEWVDYYVSRFTAATAPTP